MNITFLIGNGFDLNLGLETTYNNFIKHYQTINATFMSPLYYFKNRINEDEKLWANAELAFGQDTFNFEGENAANDFCDCHDDFCEELADYLKTQQDKVLKSHRFSEFIKLFYKSLPNYRRGLSEVQTSAINKDINEISGGFNYSFIIFNYTEIVDAFFENFSKESISLGTRHYKNTSYANSIKDIIHVHGTVNKDMILGVNDISQISNPKIFDNQPPELLNSLIKINTNRMNEAMIDEKTLKILNTSDLIYIYGMSIGDTDAIWWQRIIELLNKKRNLHIIIYAFESPKDILLRRKIIAFERSLKEKFLSFCPENNEALMERIHVVSYNIFEEFCGITKEKETTTQTA